MTMTLSLAEALRRFDDDQLAELFAARRDLTAPAPASISQLAARASAMVSARRALETLQRPELQLLEAMVALSSAGTSTPGAGVDPEALTAATGADHAALTPLLRRLRVLGLVYGDGSPESTEPGTSLTPIRVLTDVLPHPVGLAAVSAEDPSPADAHRIVAGARAASPKLAALLDSLAYGPARLRGGTESAAARALLDAGVARVVRDQGSEATRGAAQGGGYLELPRTLHLALRAPRVVEQLSLRIPQGAEAPAERFAGGRQAESLERAAAMDRLAGQLEQWDQDPPPVLKRGGVAQRDAKRWAKRWGVSAAESSVVLTAAWRAGLLGHDGEEWQCTREFDEFRQQPLPLRWAELVVCWASSSHVAGLAGTPAADAPNGGGSAQTGKRAVLSEATLRTPARRRRRRLIRHLAAHPSQEFSAELIAQILTWLFPLLPGAIAHQEAEILHAEATAWGLLVGSVPTPLLTEVANGLDEPMPRAIALLAQSLEQALPPEVDQLLLDGDLTVTVPGRPGDAVSQVLTWAEGESHGGGYQGRFTPESISHALRNGGDANELLGQLRALSLTPVPQTLEYLLLDQARRHGQVQVHAASSVITGDEAHLDQLMASPHAEPLGLTRVAPTVVLAVAAPGFAIGQIRQAGLAPSVAAGTVVGAPAGSTRSGTSGDSGTSRRPGLSGGARDWRADGGGSQSISRRAHTLHGLQARMDPSGLDDVEIPVDPNDPALQLDPHTVVARLRAAEANPDGAKLSVTEEVLAAIGDQRSLRIGVVDGRGGIEEMLVQPLSLDGGRLRARQVNAESNNASGEKNDGAPESEGGEFTVLIHRVTLG